MILMNLKYPADIMSIIMTTDIIITIIITGCPGRAAR